MHKRKYMQSIFILCLNYTHPNRRRHIRIQEHVLMMCSNMTNRKPMYNLLSSRRVYNFQTLCSHNNKYWFLSGSLVDIMYLAIKLSRIMANNWATKKTWNCRVCPSLEVSHYKFRFLHWSLAIRRAPETRLSHRSYFMEMTRKHVILSKRWVFFSP